MWKGVACGNLGTLVMEPLEGGALGKVSSGRRHTVGSMACENVGGGGGAGSGK